MMRFDSPDHLRHHLCQELVVDCGYTRVIASRVGALGSSFVRAAKTGDFTRAKRGKPPRDANSYIPRFPPGKLREFTLKELGKATGNFSLERAIGRGGFGTVFRGILSDGAVVAVKVLNKDSLQGLVQFQAEMRVSRAIMGIHHPNLVPAIGYHSSRKRNKAKIMIVYPFMANRDVHHYLGDCRPSSLTPLDWPTRKRIALRVARGISCLHQLGIVHRDIKPQNVMLDENFDPHVGDFGLAKFPGLPRNSYDAAGLHGDSDSYHYDTTQICGTRGYLPPEMLAKGHCTRKSDVFAFGVTLIQIVTGELMFVQSKEGYSYIVDRVVQLFKNEEDLTRHMHLGMLGMYDESEAIELIQLGLVCVQHDPRKRPLMPEVIAIMEGSRTTLKRRWDKYKFPQSGSHLSANNQSETDSVIQSLWIRSSSVRTSRSCGGDDHDDDKKEVCSALEFDLNEEVPGDDRNQSLRAYDFTQEEWKLEHLAGLTGSTNLRSLENDAWSVFVEVDQNEGGIPKQLSSQPNGHEVTTKLTKLLDQMCEMESDHQEAMEEMQQEQNVGHQLHGHLSGVSCYNAVQPGDANSGVSGAKSTTLANSRSLENDTWTEIVGMDQNERGNSKQLSLQASQHEVATKLREVLVQMQEMELKHQAVMEEMHQKQIAIMQSMIKMQGECIHKVNEMQSQMDQLIQKVNEMQSQMDQLKGIPQKALADVSNHSHFVLFS